MKVILILIYVIVIFDFLLERILSLLNSSKRLRFIPDELKDTFDENVFARSVQYKQKYEKLGMISATISFVALILMLYFNGFAFIDDISRRFASHPITIALVFFGIILIATEIIGLPFEIYSTFVIEEKFGFNKTTSKVFITDKIKQLLLSIIIGGLLLSAFIWFYYKTGTYFWVYLLIVYTLFSIFMSMFYSQLIVPLFNKQKPLEEGELRDAITKFAEKAGFKLKDIYVIDSSKRNTKANAYFTGLGPKKRIVLYDTLIQQLTTDEIIAVLAHEIGHYKKRHIYIGLFLSILQSAITLFILSLLISNPMLNSALGVNHEAVHVGLVVFGILYSPISLVLGILMNIVSRKNEYEADQFAAKHGLAEYLISGLKKLSKNSLSNINPHPAYVFFHYSHPTLLQRIRALKNHERVNI
jgi:STE24 endopeptidase